MKNSIIIISFAMTFWGCSPGADKGSDKGLEFRSQITSSEALIVQDQSNKNSSGIYFSIDRPSKSLNDGILYICVEHKKEQNTEKANLRKASASISLFDSEKAERGPVAMREIEKESLGITFPPGPNDGTDWKVFMLNYEANKEVFADKVAVSLDMVEFEDLNFTRVIIGKPATINSRLIGAFNEKAKSLEGGTLIKKGTDLLGTHSATQFMQFPANIFGNGSKKFAELVKFKDIPLGEETTNADTEMVRTRDISSNGGTSPIKLTRFINTTVEPITIETDEGPIKVTITARLSPNMESTGFITVNPDGSYESTTCLFPILTLQQVDDAGSPVGDAVVIDTAKEQIPGYPFYLASNGGLWTDTAPEGRLTLDNTSNFFYNNGDVNNFIHSNGLGPGTLGKCAKASVVSQI